MTVYSKLESCNTASIALRKKWIHIYILCGKTSVLLSNGQSGYRVYVYGAIDT